MNIQPWIVVFVCTSLYIVQSESEAEASVPIEVRRRQNNDFFIDINSTITHCDSVNNTYLVSQRKCVKNEELFSMCSSVVIPTKLSTNFTAVVVLQERQTSSTANSTTSNITSLLTEPKVDAILKFSETNQLVNSSFCNIASLEVFRGWKEVFVVHHNGFSLTINGTIEINKDELPYGTDDYIGELYRMNLSCSGGGLPVNGCLFFKVLGTAFVKNAKFDCTVPGTLADFTEECNITTSGSLLSMTTSTRVTTTTTTVDTDNTSNTEYGIKEIYVVVACVAALVLACVLTVFVVCIIVCLRRRKGRPHKRQTAPLGEERKSQELQCQDTVYVVDSSSGNVYHTLTPQGSTSVITKKDAETDTYAELGKPQSSVSSGNPLQYEDPVKGIPKSNKNRSNGPQEHGVSNALFHHYDQNSIKGHSDPSEHVYALPVREKKQEVSTAVNPYDQPPVEDTYQPEDLLEKESDHTYAELEKPEP